MGFITGGAYSEREELVWSSCLGERKGLQSQKQRLMSEFKIDVILREWELQATIPQRLSYIYNMYK
jgi:hypothetical protein